MLLLVLNISYYIINMTLTIRGDLHNFCSFIHLMLSTFTFCAKSDIDWLGRIPVKICIWSGILLIRNVFMQIVFPCFINLWSPVFYSKYKLYMNLGVGIRHNWIIFSKIQRSTLRSYGTLNIHMAIFLPTYCPYGTYKTLAATPFQ